MKRPILLLSLAVGIAFSACQNQAEKDAKAEDRAQDSASAQQANAQYLAFKRDADAEINANNDKIAHLRERLAKTQGQAPLDDARKRKIDDLEMRNGNLRSIINDYKYQVSDWDAFKTNYNAKRDSIISSFKDMDADK